jgi:hypothetical protein
VPTKPDPGHLIDVLHRPQPPTLQHDAVDLGTLTPAMVALAPVLGTKVVHIALPGEATSHKQQIVGARSATMPTAMRPARASTNNSAVPRRILPRKMSPANRSVETEPCDHCQWESELGVLLA